MRWASLLVVGLAAIARGTGPGPTVFTFTPMGPTGPVWSVARVRFFDADGEVSTANATASATTSLPFDPGNVLRDDDAVWSCDRTLTCGCAIVVSFRNRDASRPVINRALLTQAPPGNDTYPADSVVCIRKRVRLVVGHQRRALVPNARPRCRGFPGHASVPAARAPRRRATCNSISARWRRNLRNRAARHLVNETPSLSGSERKAPGDRRRRSSLRAKKVASPVRRVPSPMGRRPLTAPAGRQNQQPRLVVVL